MAFYKLCSILLVVCAFAAGQEEIEDFKAVEVYRTMAKISWNETEKLATYIITDINRNISRTTNEAMMTWYDLKPDTRYQFNVVISMINNSLPTLNYTSEEPLNVTTNNATFMAIANLTSMNVTMNSSKLLWQPKQGVKSYTLFHRVEGASEYTMKMTEMNMLDLNDLMPNTTYEVLVVAQANSTDADVIRGYESMKHMFRTAAKIDDVKPMSTASPNKTDNLLVDYSAGKKSLEIFWSRYANASKYIVYYREKGTDDKKSIVVPGNSGISSTKEEVELKNLKTNTEYLVTVVVERQVGNSTEIIIQSLEKTFKTDKDELLVDHSAGRKSLEIFWSRYANASEYIVYYREKGTDDKKSIVVPGNSGINSTKEEVELKNLKTNTEYLVTVVVERQVGNSTEIIIQSLERTFKTDKVIRRRSTGSRDLAASFSLFLALAFTYLFF